VGLPVLIDPGCPGGADVEPFEPQPASATAAMKAMMSLRIAVTSLLLGPRVSMVGRS
jgi:hypothetical protein